MLPRLPAKESKKGDIKNKTKDTFCLLYVHNIFSYTVYLGIKLRNSFFLILVKGILVQMARTAPNYSFSGRQARHYVKKIGK